MPGTFVYTSAAGRTLHVGNGHIESVTFIPTDTTDYTSASSNVTVNVAQATPTLTLTPINLGYGTALDNTQISGTATVTVGGTILNVPGTFTFTSANGTTLNGGSAQNEPVTFTPADTTDYRTVSSSVTVNVSTHATPIVNVNAVSLTYGTALANSQLSGFAIFTLRGNTVVVQGTYVYTTASGSVLGAGNGQSVDVTFNPNDTTTYMSVSRKVIVNVAQATPTLTINPIQITYGTALANGQLTGTARFIVGGVSVTLPGAFSYSIAGGSVLQAGNGQSEAVTFTPTDATDYTTASSTVVVNVAQATPILNSINPVTLIYGNTLANSQLSGTVSYTVGGISVPVAGTFTYTTAVGTLLNLGNGQTEAITFTPTDTKDYTPIHSTVTVNVLPITPTVTVADSGGIYNGLPFPRPGPRPAWAA